MQARIVTDGGAILSPRSTVQACTVMDGGAGRRRSSSPGMASGAARGGHVDGGEGADGSSSSSKTAVPDPLAGNGEARSPQKFVGSKGGAGVAQRIVSLMPAHSCYVEAFAGLAAVARLKRPADQTLLIEIDPARAAALRDQWAGRAQVITGDCMTLLRPDDVPEGALLYCDPPYLLTTRRSRRPIYRYEMGGAAQHRRFLRWAKSMLCRVMISGYWSQLYVDELRGWRLVQFGAGTRGGRAVECVWMNFPETDDLHDTRFVGDGYRERERIKRKTARWVRRIKAMPPAERAAILKALEG